jgi:hypothetical protein
MNRMLEELLVTGLTTIIKTMVLKKSVIFYIDYLYVYITVNLTVL